MRVLQPGSAVLLLGLAVAAPGWATSADGRLAAERPLLGFADSVARWTARPATEETRPGRAPVQARRV